MRAAPINNNPNFGGGKTKFVSTKHFDWMHKLNGTHQRMILGGTAIVTQPLIDYYNPMADEKTRQFSVLKTIIKIVVGTVVGTAVRHVGMKYAKSLTKDAAGQAKVLSKIKNPETSAKLKQIFADPHKKENFESNMGTIIGLMGVIVADFTFDLPLAKKSIDVGTKFLGLSDPKKKKEDKK
jgi:hypothetical protein